MELLTGLLCTLPCLLVPLLLFAVWMGLNMGKRNTARVEEQTAVLEALGLSATDATDWRVGEIEGRQVAVKAMRTAKVNHYETGGVRLGIQLVALFPVDATLAEHLFRNNPGRSATTFDRHYYGAAGKPAQGVPAAVESALLDWALNVPTDAAEIGPRDSASLYAGSQFPDATSLVRVESAARLEPDAARAWLVACAARVAAMETDV